MTKILKNSSTSWILLVVLGSWLLLPPVRDTFAANLLFSTDFETKTLASLFPLDCSAPANTIVGTDNGISPHSGTHMFKYNPSGNHGGCVTSITPTASVYLSKWWYFPKDFDTSGGHLGGNHVFRFWEYWSGGVKGDQWDNGLGDQQQGCGQSITYDAEPIFDRDITYWTAATFPKGRWFRFEALFKLNTPGVADGTLDLWIDGSQVFTRTKQQWLTGSNTKLSVFALTTNFDSFTCPMTATSRVWYEDDVQVWDACPPTAASCSSGSADASPPSPPTNLTVSQ